MFFFLLTVVASTNILRSIFTSFSFFPTFVFASSIFDLSLLDEMWYFGLWFVCFVIQKLGWVVNTLPFGWKMWKRVWGYGFKVILKDLIFNEFDPDLL